MKSICVFCGSSTGLGGTYEEAACSLGQEMARRGLKLVYGGGAAGLMGILANTVLEEGGAVLGIIPEDLHRRVKSLEGGETLVVPDMHSRKALMHQEAGGFIALPGGIGTFEEILEALTWGQLGIHAKAVGLLNAGGFYDSLLAQLDHCVAQGFLKPVHRESLLVDKKPVPLLDAMACWTPSREGKWIN